MQISTNNQLAQPTVDNREFDMPRGYRIPERAGSEYTDQLLRQLGGKMDGDSFAVGLIACDAKHGSTTMAINLAMRSADHLLSPTLVIDANVSEARLSKHFRCRGPGYAECIADGKQIEDVITTTKVDGLHVLGLGNRRLARQVSLHPSFLTEVRNDYRMTVVDLPVMEAASVSVSDSMIACLDGVVIVAKYGVKKERIAELSDNIQQNGGSVLGVVMTGHESKIPRWIRRLF